METPEGKWKLSPNIVRLYIAYAVREKESPALTSTRLLLLIVGISKPKPNRLTTYSWLYRLLTEVQAYFSYS